MHLDPPSPALIQDEPFAKYLIQPGKPANLASRPTDASDATIDKDEAKDRTDEHLKELVDLQEKFYADGRLGMLVCLQAMDAGGKDSTIRRCFGPINPQGVEVTSFKVPTELERRHDFLWRHQLAVPAEGMIGIFNRSHYEAVLVERVKDLVPEPVWRARYDHINHWESLLYAGGTVVVKIYLHLSKKEQAERFRDRLTRRDKWWKFSEHDLAERKRWDGYQGAFEDALTRCSTLVAPWYAIPADQKWYRDYLITGLMLRLMKALPSEYPQPPAGMADRVDDFLAELKSD